MTERLIDLAEEPARLCVRNALLVIQRQDKEDVTIPLAEIAVLVVSHSQVSFTHAVLAGIAAAGGAFVVCDGAHLPVGMLMPLQTHFVQAERFAQQAAVKQPTRKRLWRQIVRSKVRVQARLLQELRGQDFGLMLLARRIRSGDAGNVEAQASRRYWPALFPDEDFHRGDSDLAENALLNYGYAVLRAIVARAICAAGLHPSLSLHHHNRYDAFCLADDLMEPLRPIVDRAVVRYVQSHDQPIALDREAKTALVGALMERFDVEGEKRTLFDISARTASSLVGVFAGERRDLALRD